MTEYAVQLRWLSIEDAQALAIADAVAAEFPWKETQFRDGLAANEFGWCVEDGMEICAFAVCSVLLDEATLLNIAVRPEARRRGYAWALLIRSARECFSRGAKKFFLEVRESNEAAISIYRAFGFAIDGVRRDYYPSRQGRENALLMSRSLPID